MDETTSYAVKARTEMVHRVLEGLRDEAFELARDIGIESLTEPGGLRAFITQMRNVVFPRAAEEARELFRAGQRHGVLARQGGESMLSYVSRRRRWWKLLKSLGSSIELSEPMRVELLLELSGLSRQESLEDEDAEDYDDTSYPAFGDEAAEYEAHSYPAGEEDDEPSYEDFELDEEEATALNCLEDLDPEEAESGHVIQLQLAAQLAANAAFGRAKGRKGKGKGRGKSKGKVVRSHLTLEERRDKMKALKAKSKCLRCGAIGHWAGDPECKFPTSKGGKAQPKGRAHLAIVTPKQDPDGGLYVPSGNVEDAHAYMVNELGAASSKAAPARPSSAMQMEGGDRRFTHGQHKGQTYEEVSCKVEFEVMASLSQAWRADAVPDATKERAREFQRDPTTEPEFYRISDPLGTDNFLGSRDQELEADYREAILLEGLNSMHDPFPGDSSDDGAPGSYNVEELDKALERQAAEDAQRELDEAFERARHNLNEDVQPDSIAVLESGSAPRNKLQVRHVPGRDITQLGYQARQRVNVPAVPHWHGPTAQDRDAIAHEDFGFVGTVWWNSKESSFRILGLFKAKHHAQQAAEGRYHWGADHADRRHPRVRRHHLPRIPHPRSPRGPPRGPPRRSGPGDDESGGGGGPPSRPSHVPVRSADLEWRDRAIRAEALLDRLQAENQELRERIGTLEAVKTRLEEENRTLYGQACVAEQWDEWFQAQQQMGTIKKEVTEAGNELREKDGWRGEITILLRDAPMTAACPTTAEDAETKGENKYLVLARRSLRDFALMDPSEEAIAEETQLD
eukprot:s3070_g1.t2